MYSTDLTAISLDAFEETILTIDLLPSRRMLAGRITDVVPQLKRMGINNLEDLRGRLRDKGRYGELAAGLSVDEEYLTVLNREVNSYVSKPVSLTQLDVFEQPELERLRLARIRSTKDLYERCALPAERRSMAIEH
ncbi:MAG: hypothetical protein WBO25_12120, partial [Acidimicrobiia bacterium]